MNHTGTNKDFKVAIGTIINEVKKTCFQYMNLLAEKSELSAEKQKE